MSRKGQEGQALPLVAGGILGLLALFALVLDLGMVYSLQRSERAAADAAALAGAQDLQTPGSRGIGTSDYTNARRDALSNLATRYGLSPAAITSLLTACPPTSDIIGCALPGTAFNVTIKTNPSPSHVNVDPNRAIQVTVDQSDVPLTIARLFGQHDWNVASTSVAGLSFSPAYALVTLRPPRPNGSSGSDGNVDDLSLKGTNTQVNITSGDIGVNTYVVTNSASQVNLDPGYSIFHYDTGPTPDSWNNGSGSPPGVKIASYIPEPPGYSFPDQTLVGTAQGQGTYTTYTQATGADTAANCAAQTSAIVWPVQDGVSVSSLSITCYRPGVYTDSTFKIQNPTDVAYLEPGVFWFSGDVTVKGYLFGGLQSSTGVTVVIPNSANLAGASAAGIVLNAGPVSCTSPSCRATPAVLNGTKIQSPDGLPLTIMIPTIDSCFVSGTSPRMPDDNAGSPCAGTTVLNLGASSGSGGSVGSAIIRVGGAIWAPTDNASIGSNYTAQQSFVGRIVVWSVTYNGGATLNEEGTSTVKNGVVALDAACSGPGTPCYP